MRVWIAIPVRPCSKPRRRRARRTLGWPCAAHGSSPEETAENHQRGRDSGTGRSRGPQAGPHSQAGRNRSKGLVWKPLPPGRRKRVLGELQVGNRRVRARQRAAPDETWCRPGGRAALSTGEFRRRDHVGSPRSKSVKQSGGKVCRPAARLGGGARRGGMLTFDAPGSPTPTRNAGKHPRRAARGELISHRPPSPARSSPTRSCRARSNASMADLWRRISGG